MTSQKIIETNYGIASKYSNFTEINFKLVGELRKKIMKHENRHKSDRHYTKEDFKNDFQAENSYFFESFKFAFLNPEALVGFFPFMYSYFAKDWTFNYPAVIPFLWFGIIFSGIVSLFLKNSFFMNLLYYTILFAALNTLLLIITHIHVKKQKSFLYKEVLE